MEHNNAKRKRACPSTSTLAGDLDRLSGLPDCLLHTIMSFMKARQMVQTCVLSTRWRHLWRSVPCLNIDSNEFKVSERFVTRVPDSDDSDDDYNSVDKKWEDFVDFAVILMIRRSIAALDSFRLRAPSFADTEAGRWIRRAMKYCAPDPVIQREGLSSSSWRLKRLHLCNVSLDDLFAKHVSSVCHSLEDLELHGCSCQNIHSITSHSLKNLILKSCSLGKLSDVTSPSLKTLVIDDCWTRNTCPLLILTPDVAYLHLALNFAYFGGGISINEMPCLAKALIRQWGCISESKCSGNLLKLFCGVSNVKSLELKGFGTMVLGEESTPFQEFKNLRNLLLDNCDLTFLQNSPNLEKLTLQHCKVLGEESTPFQEFKNLRNLLLDNCDLTDNFHTLGLFLQNSPNLEKLTLQHCKFLNDSKKKKGTPKGLKPSKPTSFECQSLDVQCENLELTEIIYKDDDARQLVELLLRISGKLPKNYIKLTKVD